MIKLFEIICIKNGVPQNIYWHNHCLNQARIDLLEKYAPIHLEQEIIVPQAFSKGKWKCKVTYTEKIEEITFSSYQIPTIRSMMLVNGDYLEYAYKFEDRSQLVELYQLREKADDIIITKNGLITDSYFGNLVFDDGTRYLTPNRPLLRGTKRSSLIAQQLIQTAIIRPNDIRFFKRVHIINTMIDLGECVVHL
jgi:4-amino-4-deoxychorismate lyase